MNDGDTTTVRLADLLRHPDDLDKISALKAEFTRKKTAIDSQLKVGLQEQLQLTKAGMDSLSEGQRITNLIKEEMMKIDRLCGEAQNMIKNFPEINAVAEAHRNFLKVEEMKRMIEGFNERVEELEYLVREDDENLEVQPNLLKIHLGLSQLRELRDDAMEQVQKADDRSVEQTLKEHFRRLDDLVEDFDSHVGHACMRLLDSVARDNTEIVVKLAIVVEKEEEYDNRIKELRSAQQEYKDFANHFTSLAVGQKELRGYKDNFLNCIKQVGQGKMDKTDQAFMEDPDRLEKSLKWFFTDLNIVKIGMTNLMPKKWRIFRTYVKIYHQLMCDFLNNKAADQAVTPTHMLAIIHWRDKYHAKMERLGASPSDLQPPAPGGSDSDLVREYRQLIIDKVEQWMNQLNKTDRLAFVERRDSAIEHDDRGYFRTKSLGDMWHMLREQLIVASNADMHSVSEAVTDAMFRALKTRQDMWNSLLTEELEKSSRTGFEPESIQGVQDWLIALANDQMTCILNPDYDGPSLNGAQDPETTPLGYLSAFRRDYESLVSSEYTLSSATKFDAIKEGFTDVGFRCISVFAKLIIAVDFRTVLPDFFTPGWYNRKQLMGQIVSTFEDYLSDYASTMPELLRDILVEEMAKQLLVAYLGCVRNRGAKFRRQDPFDVRLREDVLAVFGFFERYPGSSDAIREQWRVVEGFLGLLECEKVGIVGEVESFLRIHWDARLGWVEAVLRCRDDVDFGTLGEGKTLMKNIRARAAEVRSNGMEATIMAEVA